MSLIDEDATKIMCQHHLESTENVKLHNSVRTTIIKRTSKTIRVIEMNSWTRQLVQHILKGALSDIVKATIKGEVFS